MSQTYYIAPLKCQYCYTISPVDTSTDMCNNATYDPGNVIFGINDTLPIDLDDLTCDAFHIRTPESNRVKFVEFWQCPTCKRTNLAEIQFLFHEEKEEAVIEDIHSVVLTSDYLDEVHYLGMWFNSYIEYIIDERIFATYETTPEEVARLKELLDKENS